ncbi:putative sugar nucleotidyl transferase, partial [Flavobacteriaceae bacterium]|nr:putative sugar nucleotidyl transferase [Flavobacteriaceae bacterium]
MSKSLNFILFDGKERNQLLPFTYTRPVAEIRIGIDTLKQKWEYFLGQQCSFLTQDYLDSKFPSKFGEINIFINPTYIPSMAVAKVILSLKKNQVLTFKGAAVAYCSSNTTLPEDLNRLDQIECSEELTHIKASTDLFIYNSKVLKEDFNRITKGRISEVIEESNRVVNSSQIFVESGAKVSCSILNATDGPIYIGANAEIMEGSILRGSIAVCENATVKMGAKIYGGTTIGPSSKVGGELSNALFLGYSNKGHDGFIGNAVIGEWCNIGAASDASNLKNNYSKIRVWNYETQNFSKTELQFCGLLMGDFSRCGIHSMFNTATVVGINSNVFGTGFPRTFIP